MDSIGGEAPFIPISFRTVLPIERAHLKHLPAEELTSGFALC